jgi:hypothetical protein
LILFGICQPEVCPQVDKRNAPFQYLGGDRLAGSMRQRCEDEVNFLEGGGPEELYSQPGISRRYVRMHVSQTCASLTFAEQASRAQPRVHGAEPK